MTASGWPPDRPVSLAKGQPFEPSPVEPPADASATGEVWSNPTVVGSASPPPWTAPPPRPADTAYPGAPAWPAPATAAAPTPFWSPVPVGAPPPPFAGPPVPPSAPGGRRSTVWLIAGLVAVVVLIGGVLAAVLISRSGDDTTPVASAPTPAAPTSPDFGTVTTPPVTSAAPTPTVPTTSAPPTTSPGGIDLSAVSANPDAPAVAQVFDTYFGGVNAHDANAALSVFDPSGVINPSDPAQVAKFAQATSSTTDDQIAVDAIAPAATGLAVSVHFRSTQAASLGPGGETCTLWTLVYDLTRAADGSLLIHGSHAQHAAC